MAGVADISPLGLYSKAEVGEILRIGRGRVEWLIEAGHLRSREIAGQQRVIGASVLGFLGLTAAGDSVSEPEDEVERPPGRWDHLPPALRGYQSGVDAVTEVALIDYAEAGRLESYLEARRLAKRRQRQKDIRMPRAQWLERLRAIHPQDRPSAVI